MKESTCVFCQIVAKKAPANLIYEDDAVIAFLDNRPASEGHVLIIPNNHYEQIYDFPEEEIEHLFRTVKKISLAIRKGINPEGLSIIQRNGAAAGQRIFHLHINLIPRYIGKKLYDMEELQPKSIEELDKTAHKIKRYL